MQANKTLFLATILKAFEDFFPEAEKQEGDVKPKRVRERKDSWSWRDVFTLAGRAGVDPWDYSLRELVWMAHGKNMAMYDHAAWICMHIPSFSKERKVLADFHPMLREQQKQSAAGLRKFIDEAKDILPETLSEEEQRRRFEEWKNVSE